MFVLTMDQRGSQKGADRVPELLAMLSDAASVLPFERSVGDEVQGVMSDANAVVEVALGVLRTGQWYVGIGVGGVKQPLPASPREASGPAFVAARAAVDRAKKTGERVPLSVRAGNSARSIGANRGGSLASGRARGAAADHAAAAEAVLCLLGRLVRDRTDAEWRVLDLLQPGTRGQQALVAARLGISPQAVSKAVFRSGWQEEQGARAAAATLLELADGTL